MVSLRRRRLLGYSTGLPPCYFDDQGVPQFGTPPSNRVNAQQHPIPYYFDDEGVARFGTGPSNQVNAHPIPSTETNNEEIPNSSTAPDSLNMMGSSSLKDQGNDYGQQAIPKMNNIKKHKHENNEQFSLRGVYYKNMRWQAAIKVNNKQVHLGTLRTQEDAAHIYDRAAFVCGRAPNYELPKEEQEELKKMNWDAFMERTKNDLSYKRKRNQCDESGLEDKSLEVQDNEPRQGAGGSSFSKYLRRSIVTL